jgi:hypothetical protein
MSKKEVQPYSHFSVDQKKKNLFDHNEKELSKHRFFCCFRAQNTYASRDARWFIFKPKIPIWANFVGPKMGKYC